MSLKSTWAVALMIGWIPVTWLGCASHVSAARLAAQYAYAADRHDTLTITKYTGPGGGVVIPRTLSGLPVTSIEHKAFAGCTNLASVTIPATVTSIGVQAFAGCSGLTNVMIPSSVTSLGEGAFVDCDRLTGITVDAQNPVYSSVDGVLFNKRQTTLIKCPDGKIGSYTIPQGVTQIGVVAFYDCYQLTQITIPDGVTRIGNWAFGFCIALPNLTLPASVTSVGDWVFGNCTTLTGVHFTGNAPRGSGARLFDEISRATVYYSEGTTGWEWTFGGRPTGIWTGKFP